MEVYVVSEICDYEYYCTEVLFVTANKKYAKQYCKEHNVRHIGWDGFVRDTVTYEKYVLEG